MTATMNAAAALLAGVPRVKPLNATPDKDAQGRVVYPYGVYSALLGRGTAYTLNAAHGMRWGRVIVQTFGRTSASALDHMDDAITLMLDSRLTIVGYECSPMLVELDPAVVRDPDDSGVVGTTATLTFTATPT